MSDLKSTIESMAAEASGLLDALTPEQRQEVSFTFNDDEREKWFYTPVARTGLSITNTTPKQQQKVMRLLATGLSEAGYNHASLVMGMENILDRGSDFPERDYGGIPGTRQRDPRNYFLAIFGTPGSDSWNWRLSGHHFSLHYTIANGQLSPTPAFFGAEPARARMAGGVTMRPLAAEEDFARELLELLTPGQREQAVIAPVAPTDIVQMNRSHIEDGALHQIGGNGPGGERRRAELGSTPEYDEMVRYTSKPKGLAGGDMTTPQRALMARLVSAYFEHLHDAVAEQYDPLFERDALNAMHFAWAGSAAYAGPHYYRVQAERMLIEYDCTQNNSNHTHSVLRDPLGDFGADLMAEHYVADHRR